MTIKYNDKVIELKDEDIKQLLENPTEDNRPKVIKIKDSLSFGIVENSIVIWEKQKGKDLLKHITQYSLTGQFLEKIK